MKETRGLRSALVPKVYDLLVEAVECGVAHGWRRYDEFCGGADYSDEAKTFVAEEVLNAICERFNIVDDGIDIGP